MCRKLKSLLFFIISTLYVLLTVTGCSNDSDIMVTYKGGKITRGELYEWVKQRSPRAQKDHLFRSNRDMENRLKSMAFQKILVLEAKENGFLNTPRIKKYINLISDYILAQQYIEQEIISNNKEEFDIAKARHIFLRIKNYKVEKKKRINLNTEELEKAKNEQIKIAEKIINDLKSGAKFEDLANRYSEDRTRHRKGDAGFIIKGMMPDQYVDVLYSLNEGKFADKPVVTTQGVYVIFLDKKKKIKINEISDEVEDKNQANRLERKLKTKIVFDYINSLKKDSDVKFNEKNLEKKTGKDPVFMAGSIKYNVDEVNEAIEVIMGNRVKGKKEMPLPKKKQLVKKIFENYLVKRKALSAGFDKNEKYKEKKASIIEMIITREFQKKATDIKIEITEKKIRAEYDQNKSRYYKTVRQGKKTVKKPLAYKDAKMRIENALMNRERSQKMREWRMVLEKKYQIKVDKSKLDVKEEKNTGNKRNLPRKRKVK